MSGKDTASETATASEELPPAVIKALSDLSLQGFDFVDLEEATAKVLAATKTSFAPATYTSPLSSADTRKCCNSCGYRGVYLPVRKDNGNEIATCHECLVYGDRNSSENTNNYVVAWMPGYSRQAVSATIKLLAILSVASSEEQLMERYTSPNSDLFADTIDKIHEQAREAFSDISELLKFIASHCAKFAKEIYKDFRCGIVSAKELFGTDSMSEFNRLYDLSDSETRKMIDVGVRFIPRSVSKDQTGSQQIAFFLSDLISSLSDGKPVVHSLAGPTIGSANGVAQNDKTTSSHPVAEESLHEATVSGPGTAPTQKTNQDGGAS